MPVGVGSLDSGSSPCRKILSHLITGPASLQVRACFLPANICLTETRAHRRPNFDSDYQWLQGGGSYNLLFELSGFAPGDILEHNALVALGGGYEYPLVDANSLFCVLDDMMTMTASYGRWLVDARGNGKLRLQKCDWANLGISDSTEYAFSFSFTNPAREQPAPTISVNAWLDGGVNRARDAVRQWRAIEVVKPSCLGCDADTTRLGVFGGADPLRIIEATFVTKAGRQSNPVATRLNTMTVELEPSVVIATSSFPDLGEGLVAGVQVCNLPMPYSLQPRP